jgi:hypothetical protein
MLIEFFNKTINKKPSVSLGRHSICSIRLLFSPPKARPNIIKLDMRHLFSTKARFGQTTAVDHKLAQDLTSYLVISTMIPKHFAFSCCFHVSISHHTICTARQYIKMRGKKYKVVDVMPRQSFVDINLCLKFIPNWGVQSPFSFILCSIDI